MKSEYIDIFDDYSKGTLTEKEQESFKIRLESDKEFLTAYQEYKYLRDGINYSIMKTLKEELQELEATLPDVALEPDTKLILEQLPKSNQSIIWKAAAVFIAVAISAGVLIFQLQSPSSPQDLFSQYYEPYPNNYISQQRGEDESANALVQSFQAYDADNFQVAISGFESILNQQEEPLVLFYMGSAQLHEGRGAAAIATFTRYLEISNELQEDAHWYLALSYLSENRTNEAMALLEGLSHTDERGEQAKKILSKLE